MINYILFYIALVAISTLSQALLKKSADENSTSNFNKNSDSNSSKKNTLEPNENLTSSLDKNNKTDPNHGIIKNKRLKEYLNWKVIVSYSIFIGVSLTQPLAYRGFDFKLVPALETTGFIFISIFGWLFFREKLTKNNILGILLIVSGVIVFQL